MKKYTEIIVKAKKEYEDKNNCYVEYDEDWVKICNIALNMKDVLEQGRNNDNN